MTSDRLGARLSYKFVSSPIGVLKLVASEKGLVAILWKNDNPRRVRVSDVVEDPFHPVLVQTGTELQEYFAGKRRIFSVPLDMRGTPFQKQVWEALLAIPFAETCAYGDLAKQIGNPAATRAVGAANGRNPIAIIVPCHRVIGATGNLTGFAGGLEAKGRLLTLEGAKVRNPKMANNGTEASNQQLFLVLGIAHSSPSGKSTISPICT